MSSEFAIVDIFAGPGGLAEGFSSIRSSGDVRPFSVVLSVEKELAAYSTLLLRSFLRQFGRAYPKEYYRFLNGEITEPDWEVLYPRQWNTASKEALHLELGSRSAVLEVNAKIDAIKERFRGNIILIGGPPCQAYSLVGRARNMGIEGYSAKDDHRHFLYREYIRILKRLQPAAFVMENVKGMLSSRVDGEKVFDKVLHDLESVGAGNEGYRLVTLGPRPKPHVDDEQERPRSKDFIIKSESYGLPQARHRVIVVGIRKDLAGRIEGRLSHKGLLAATNTHATVRDVLAGMPKLRSGLSQSEDNDLAWKKAVVAAMEKVSNLKPLLPPEDAKLFRMRARHYLGFMKNPRTRYHRSSAKAIGIGPRCPKKLRRWLLDPSLKIFPNNDTRAHMPSDLARYFFTAVFGEVSKESPKASEFPRRLTPQHRNWDSGKFADRFRVQLWSRPSATVTSHISKDGHYFIHPDPAQCRSLTVREAARLQTFPDNYFFKGNRTEQYIQVGNAVPPFLAKLIAQALYGALRQAMRPNRRKPRKSK